MKVTRLVVYTGFTIPFHITMKDLFKDPNYQKLANTPFGPALANIARGIQKRRKERINNDIQHEKEQQAFADKKEAERLAEQIRKLPGNPIERGLPKEWDDNEAE